MEKLEVLTGILKHAYPFRLRVHSFMALLVGGLLPSLASLHQ